MKIGYARVSTDDQNLDRQLGALRAVKCSTIFREKASGKSTRDRPELAKALDALGKGDVLVVAEWDRATRSMMDGLALIERVAARGASMQVLDRPHFDISTTLGKAVVALLSGLAQDERERIMRRAAQGRKAAKRRGVHMGRPEKLTDEQKAHAVKLLRDHSCREVGRLLGVHHSTISRLQKSA